MEHLSDFSRNKSHKIEIWSSICTMGRYHANSLFFFAEQSAVFRWGPFCNRSGSVLACSWPFQSGSEEGGKKGGVIGTFNLSFKVPLMPAVSVRTCTVQQSDCRLELSVISHLVLNCIRSALSAFIERCWLWQLSEHSRPLRHANWNCNVSVTYQLIGQWKSDCLGGGLCQPNRLSVFDLYLLRVFVSPPCFIFLSVGATTAIICIELRKPGRSNFLLALLRL